MKILLIDNFDSFTYNLAHYIEGMGAEVTVLRENLYKKGLAKHFDKIIISPGSGLPEERSGMILCLSENMDTKPILGVCLGMQALISLTHGELYNQNKVKHGIVEQISRQGESKLLEGLPVQFNVGLYHSWATELGQSEEWVVTSVSANDVIMSIESNKRPLFGVQFHPESIMTDFGKQIIQNFLAQ